MRLKGLVLFFVLSYPLHAENIENLDQLEIQERIQPIGKIHIQNVKEKGEESILTPGTSDKPEGQKKQQSGQTTYERYCILCHRDGVAGAPKFQNPGDWKPRLAGKTLDDIVAIAMTGLNAMPPKGTCVECSEADIKEAIQYMLPK